MQVYAAKFHGHYPVGAFAVVVARDKQEAIENLRVCLGAHHNLSLEGVELTPIATSKPLVLVLSDGDY